MTIRWIVLAILSILIVLSTMWLHVMFPLRSIIVLMFAWSSVNLLSYGMLRHKHVTTLMIMAQLAMDICFFTAFLYCSGGATNPFTSVYMLWVVMGAMLLPGMAALGVFLLAAIGYLLLLFDPQPMLMLSMHHGGLIHVVGMLISFILGAAITMGFVMRMARLIKEQEQHVLEERANADMGLVAAAAAHELSTPLSSVAMMISELKYDYDIELVDACEKEIRRCHVKLRDVLGMLGTDRYEVQEPVLGELYFETLIKAMDESVIVNNDLPSQWTVTPSVIVDKVIHNIVQNALKARTQQVRVSLAHSENTMVVSIYDDGPGLSDHIVALLNEAPHRLHEVGFGLFISSRLLTRLKGSLMVSRVSNQTCISLTFPLESLNG